MKLYRIIHKEDGYKEKLYVTAEDYADINAMIERWRMDVQKIELLTEDAVDCKEDLLPARKPAFMMELEEAQTTMPPAWRRN